MKSENLEGNNSEEDSSRSSTPVNTPNLSSSGNNLLEKPPQLLGSSPGKGNFLGMGIGSLISTQLMPSNSPSKTEPSIFKTKRQQKHANLMMEKVPELAQERFQLVPEKLTEEEFWLFLFFFLFKIFNIYKKNILIN